MRRALALLIAAMLVGGCAQGLGVVPAAAPNAAERLTVIDLTDEFAAAYQASEGMPPSARLARIGELTHSDLPGFYDPARFGDRSGMYTEMAGRFFAAYPAQATAVADIAGRFTRMFDPAVADFERRIGPLPTTVPVYLVISMGEFDGATRELAGRTRLLFGADMIAQLHGGEARAFVQHELFHLYHGARFDACNEIWCGLWNEGLAVYAAQTLNPQASDAELLLTVPEPIRPVLAKRRKEAICAVRTHLDSRDGSVRNALLSGGRLAPGLPPRFGYLVGLWVAQDLGRNASLAEMAEWDGLSLRDRIGASLEKMASCP